MNWAGRTLAGLEVGVFGGLAVAVWYGVHSWLRDDFWWSKFNVAAGSFFGSQVFQMGPSRATLAGAAFLICLYSIAGIAAACVTPLRAGILARLAVTILFILALHYVFEHAVLRQMNPFAKTYFPSTATIPAHLIFGLWALRLPAAFRGLSDLQGAANEP